MSDPKFTPGPWHANGWDVYDDTIPEMYVASCPFKGPHDEDWSLVSSDAAQANARLIAAAPDLLEALQLEVSAYPSGSSIDPNKTKWLEAARAAIKKALGDE